MKSVTSFYAIALLQFLGVINVDAEVPEEEQFYTSEERRTGRKFVQTIITKCSGVCFLGGFFTCPPEITAQMVEEIKNLPFKLQMTFAHFQSDAKKSFEENMKRLDQMSSGISDETEVQDVISSLLQQLQGNKEAAN